VNLGLALLVLDAVLDQKASTATDDTDANQEQIQTHIQTQTQTKATRKMWPKKKKR
jgi:hypothetical protein